MLSILRDIEKCNEFREEGYAEGRAEAKEEIILNMLKYYSPDEIYELTEIPLEEIITIQEEHNVT